MRKLIARLSFCLFILASLGGPAPTLAAPSTPSGIYQEDFSTYQFKDFTRTAVWDKWNHQARLQQSATDQYMPAVAAAPDGGVYAAFSQADGVYTQRLDARGSRLWQNAVQVTDEAHTYISLNNQIALAALPQPLGGAIVVWYLGDKILAQRLSAEGALIWPQPLEIDPSNQDSWVVPTVTAYTDGSVLVTWSGNGAMAQRISADGDFLWDAPVAVAVDGGEQAYTRSALDGNENAIIVWCRGQNLFAQSLNSSGNRRWTAGDVPVNAENGVVERRYDSTLSLDAAADGSAIIAWTTIYNNGSQRIASAQRLNSAGARLWAQDVRVSAYHASSELSYLETVQPVVAVDASGGALVTFQADTPGEQFQMHAMRLTAMGQRAWAQDTALTTDQPINYSTAHTNSITPTGDVWVGWYQGSNDVHPYAHKLNLSGTLLLDGQIPLMDDTGLAAQTRPALAASPDGGAFVAWEDNRRGVSDVYVTRQTAEGQPAWKTDIRVNDDDPTARSNTTPSIAVDPQGNALVTYLRHYDNSLQVFAQKMDANGNKLWPVELALTGQRNMFAGSISAAATSDGSFILTWLEMRWQDGINDVVAQKLSPEGQALWAAGGITVNDNIPLRAEMQPRVVIDQQDIAYIFWASAHITGTLPDDWHVFAQCISPAGARQWPADVKLSDASSDTQLWLPANPGALFANGSLYVAWATQNSGNVGQRILPNGSLAWASPKSIGDLYPFDASAAPDGSIYLSGTTANHPGAVIKVDAQGQVTQSSLTFPTPPLMAYWPDGPVAAAYTSQGQGPDIQVTSIEAALGGADWPVTHLAEPEEFSLERGLVQSLAVDTLAENIARATLTADEELNGGEILLSLSNDDGATWQAAVPGIAVTFPTLGSDLRWRAELVRDPAWPRRSPLISALRIEYTAAAPNADRYEVDDTCQQATTLETGGVSQEHTLHTAEDVDWVRFEVQNGKTYLVQASEAGINADTYLELFDQCGAQMNRLESDANLYNGEAQIAYTAAGDGTWYAAAHNLGAGGADSGYALSIRELENTPIAVIIAGPSPDLATQQALEASGDRAYRLLLKSSPRADIRYMAPDPSRDVDGNKLLDDIFAAPTNDLLRDTIQDWARERGAQLGRPFYLLILSDGEPGLLLSHLDGGGVDPAALGLWLDNLKSTSGADQINVVLEAPYAGGFLSAMPSIAGPKRVIITAAGADQLAYFSTDGAYFTSALLDGLEQRLSLHDAFTLAAQAVAARGLPQTPELDDNGDCQPEPMILDATSQGIAQVGQLPLPDGLAAAGRGLALATSAQPPVVDQVALKAQTGGTAQLSVRARGSNVIDKVWVEAFSVGFPQGPMVSGTKFYLQPTGQAGLYAVTSISTAQYQRLVITASDKKGNRSRPVAVITRYPIFLPVVRR